MDHDRTGSGEPDVDINFANEDDPTFIPNPAGLTPDERTMAEALRVVQSDDPDFLFVNLGAVDRVGHADITGPVVPGVTDPIPVAVPNGNRPVLRDLQRTNTDTLLRLFVQTLEAQGRWDNSVLLLTADHSMDWSLPQDTVSLFSTFQADPLLTDSFTVAQNGGAALYSLRDRTSPDAQKRLARMRALALDVEGVDEVLYRQPNPEDGGEAHWVGTAHPDWHQTGPRSGDLLLTVKDTYRVTEPSSTSNPIPGNHGMPSTLRIPFLVSGGLDVARQRVAGDDDPFLREDDQAENVDVAPTAAWLMGLEEPTSGFDGRVLSEAFASRPTPVCAAGGPTTQVPGPTPSATSSPAAAPTSGGRLPATGPALLVPLGGVALALAAAAALRRRRSTS
jgi:hypothetical protein